MENRKEIKVEIENHLKDNSEFTTKLAKAANIERSRQLTEAEILAVAGGSMNMPCSN